MEVLQEEVLEDGTVLRHDSSGVPEVEPPRFDRDDAEGIRESLRVHGFATCKEAMLPHEVEEGRRLLWQFLEGDEEKDAQLHHERPVGRQPDLGAELFTGRARGTVEPLVVDRRPRRDHVLGRQPVQIDRLLPL